MVTLTIDKHDIFTIYTMSVSLRRTKDQASVTIQLVFTWQRKLLLLLFPWNEDVFFFTLSLCEERAWKRKAHEQDLTRCRDSNKWLRPTVITHSETNSFCAHIVSKVRPSLQVSGMLSSHFLSHFHPSIYSQ